MKYKTTAQFAKWLKKRHGGARVFTISDVKEATVAGEPVIVVFFKAFPDGVILDKAFAAELTQRLGPHPLVERYFREH